MNFKLWTRRSPNSTTFSAYRIYPLCDNPKKGTTPAKGGGGGGRRVSAPGGRADTHST